MNDFAVFSDIYGNILKVVSNGEFEKSLDVADNLGLFIDSAWSFKYFEFLKKLKIEGYLIGYELNFLYNNSFFLGKLNGYFKCNRLFIIALFSDSETTNILNDILIMNSNYINRLLTDLELNSLNSYNMDEHAYTEISRLNNELINSKRVIAQQNAKLIEYTETLEELALKDSLTGVYNRRYFNKRINQEIENIKKLHSSLVLISIDFDNFKMVNDKLGHSVGDELLRKFALICNKFLRQNLDLVFRLGGDEFIIISLQKDKEYATTLIKKINDNFKKHTEISELSYGIVTITPNETNDKFCLDKYLKEADEKMYLFKRTKKKF